MRDKYSDMMYGELKRELKKITVEINGGKGMSIPRSYPKVMCNKHLLGEHVEMHMFIGCINKNISLKGYILKGLVELHNIKKRHDELVKEMEARKMKHKSPIKEFIWVDKVGKVDIEANYKELANRCNRCRGLQK
jgi:hypothetical protein